MPHQCVRCSKIYEDGSKEILAGCSACSGRFFFFMKNKDMETAKTLTAKLTPEDKAKIEQDALDLVGEDKSDRPVVLDFESIRILKPGKFEIDLIDLFKGKPIVCKLEEGKYVIDLASSFKLASKQGDDDEDDDQGEDDSDDE